MTLPALNPLKSSNLSAATFHDGALYVQFTNGTAYRYPTATQELYDGLAKTDSPGRYFFDKIKRFHAGEKIG